MKKLNISSEASEMLSNQTKYPAPSPFYFDKNNVKAIVLGCDPSNRSDNNKPKLLSTVFVIGSNDPRYFRDILKNLNLIGLHLEDLYIQNVIPFYMKEETAKNNFWDELAVAILPSLIKELDSFDKKRKIPVFMTSEVIYKFLLTDRSDYKRSNELYTNSSLLPITPSQNKLGRALYPLYRHPSLSRPL